MENNLQARRVIYITDQLLSGKKLTVNSLHEHFTREYPTLTKRTLQRDMVLIGEILPLLESEKKGREYVWFYPKSALTGSPKSYLTINEILSLYFLKAYLKLFTGTMIQEHADILIEKIEEMAPDDIIPKESFFGDKNIGFYDYSHYDPTIRKIIRLIREKKLADIEYINHTTNSNNIIQGVFLMIFTYSEMLYVVLYNPKYDSHLALSIHNIIEINEHNEEFKNLPEFDFNSWSKERFGVFWGEPVKVEIEIRSDVKHYFENRFWHHSQKLVKMKNGNVILKMDVPIVPDFTAWLMSWGDSIKILKPKELIIKLKRKYQSALDLYDY